MLIMSDYSRWKAAKKKEVAEAAPEKEIPDFLRSIDDSLTTIKRIAIWWLVLSVLAVLGGITLVLNKL
jgi:hypothetical protein